jgi:hypothetical protein
MAENAAPIQSAGARFWKNERRGVDAMVGEDGREDRDAEDAAELAQRAVCPRGDARLAVRHGAEDGVRDRGEAERGADPSDGHRDPELRVAHPFACDRRDPAEPDGLELEAHEHEPSEVARANETTNTVRPDSRRPAALARTWKTVRKPRTVATSMR